jgi:hypothetical protein
MNSTHRKETTMDRNEKLGKLSLAQECLVNVNEELNTVQMLVDKVTNAVFASSEEDPTRITPDELPPPPNPRPFDVEYAVEGIHALEQWILQHSDRLPRRDYRVGMALLDDLKEHITWEPPFLGHDESREKTPTTKDLYDEAKEIAVRTGFLPAWEESDPERSVEFCLGLLEYLRDEFEAEKQMPWQDYPEVYDWYKNARDWSSARIVHEG